MGVEVCYNYLKKYAFTHMLVCTHTYIQYTYIQCVHTHTYSTHIYSVYTHIHTVHIYTVCTHTYIQYTYIQCIHTGKLDLPTCWYNHAVALTCHMNDYIVITI